MVTSDEHKLEQLYREYARELYWVALAYTRDEALANDHVHDVFLYLAEHPDQLEHVENPFAYLVRMLKNGITDYYRHLDVERKHEPLIVEELRYDLEEDAFVVDDEYLRQLSLAKRLLASLPPRCRTIFTQAVIEGRSYKEIAEAEGVSLNTVKTQVRIGMRKLKEGGGVSLLLILLLQIK